MRWRCVVVNQQRDNCLIHCDIAVIGAGPAGTVAAAILARCHVNVVIVDPLELSTHKVGESVPSAMAALLSATDFDGLDECHHMPISGSETLWCDERLSQDAFTQPGGMGWRLDRCRFEQQLLTKAMAAGANAHQGRLQAATRQSEQWQLTLDDGQRLQAAFVIDASGRNGALVRLLGVERQTTSPLMAAWSLSEAVKDGHAAVGKTLIESDETGWWYGAQLPSRKWLAIYHTHMPQAKRLRQTDGLWRSQLSDTALISQFIDPSLFDPSALTLSDARGGYLKQAYGDGWAACGDAALSFDPISSQGIFNAMATAHQLATTYLNAQPQEDGLQWQRYQHQLNRIYRAYHQRRQGFYLRAMQHYDSEFWKHQCA
ncbi:hypothetical protein FCL42_15875 [Ferrimonas aestuarii]|uniref:Dehydrogenase (Flavoprotein) n=1 Tax=Ferrimonas aestuarii TaxID=2569539 RepID=A0A4U1BKN9_9GAMM|nr:hypothetical protein FCL42_15875 [Ferrimonas aestuarii]